MKHITELSIKQYRGIQNASFLGLSNVNIFVGENNAGKTSILEAIQLASNPLSLSEYQNVSRMRERHIAPLSRMRTSSEELLSWMFPLNYETKKRENISLKLQFEFDEFEMKSLFNEEEYDVISGESGEGIDEQDPTYLEYQTIRKILIDGTLFKNGSVYDKAELVFNDPNNTNRRLVESTKKLFNSVFISAIDHRVLAFSPLIVNELIKSGDRPKLIHALQQFDDEITGIELLIEDITRSRAYPIPYIEHKKLGLVPISMFGDGLRKALTIASMIIRSKGSVLLIDEIETGIHTKIIPIFFEWITEMCQAYEVQIFATTHSLEALDGMLQANQNHLNRLSVYRLEGLGSQMSIRHFSGEKLDKLRNILGQDVR